MLICLLTHNILSSSIDAISLGIDDTPVSLLANTLSEPANDDVNVALLSENIIKKYEDKMQESTFEPHCEKTSLWVSDQVRHKPGCTTTEDG